MTSLHDKVYVVLCHDGPSDVYVWEVHATNESAEQCVARESARYPRSTFVVQEHDVVNSPG